MESEQYSRIIFIHINDLQKIRFNKLEQVCDKVYVFVDKHEKTIPLYLVQQLQHLGESVKWVAVNGSSESVMANYISFYMGRLHDQLDKDIEFAIISENTHLDNLIQFINDKGRGCIRVTRNKEKSATPSDLNGITWSTQKEEKVEKEVAVREIVKEPVVAAPVATPAPLPKTEAVVQKVVNGQVTAKQQLTQNSNIPLSYRVAKETIKRLVLSGNRPAALDSLKSYILLQYNSDAVQQQIDTIIQEMQKSKEILVQDEEVIYNF